MVSITERALIQRINRKLAHDLETVRKLRQGDSAFEYVDLAQNYVLDAFDDLEQFARECGVMNKCEVLA